MTNKLNFRRQLKPYVITYVKTDFDLRHKLCIAIGSVVNKSKDPIKDRTLLDYLNRNDVALLNKEVLNLIQGKMDVARAEIIEVVSCEVEEVKS